jgi:hypothetical protein
MPVVTIDDPVKYGQALEVLLKNGGTVHTRFQHKMILTRRQFDRLVEEGVLPLGEESTDRGEEDGRSKR